ncbi:MAG: EF-hand domain-containing protein [Pseudomonadota bacterium]
MKKTTLAAGAAAVLAVLTAGSVLAQQAPTRAPRADADGDGRISRAEFVDGRIARLTAIDANRDGSVSAEERQSGVDTRRNQRASARFEALDKNGDGAVSREEFTDARETRADRGGRQGMRGMRGGHRGGRNGGGAERAEARGPVSIAEMQTRVAAQFDRLDADHDGFVTVEERRAGRDTMREQRRERRGERRASRPAPASE